MNKSLKANNVYKLLILLGLSIWLCFFSNFSEAADKPRLRVITTIGSFTVELYSSKSPKNVKSILQHTDAGFYNGTIFHRVVKNFIVQTGAYNQEMALLKPLHTAVANEANNGLKNLRGTVAMARTAEPHSALAQFFINIKNNPHLDHTNTTNKGWGYTVVGKVISGMNIVRRMSRVTTNEEDTPLTPIVIKRISRI